MPAFADLTIADGQASPANHTFRAMLQNPLGVFNYLEQSAANPLGYIRWAWSLRFPAIGARVSSQDRVYRVKQSIVLPTMESTSASTGTGIPPAPTLAYETRSTVEYVIPERATLQERKDINAYTKNGLAHASWTAQAVDLIALN